MDVKRFLLTDEMEQQFEEYGKLTTDAEIEKFHTKWNEKYLQKTPAEQEFDDAKMLESINAISERVNELTESVRLGEVAKIISVSYLARKYFGKTRTWLYQRLNGNMVNGKPVRFTPSERQKLSEALDDISCLIKDTALKIV